MVEIIITEIMEGVDIGDELLKYISDERKLRISKLKKDDKKRCMLAELLIKKVAHDKLNLPVNSINIHTGIYGKPFISSTFGFDFNLSHSGRYIVIAVSNEQVGIDIEKRMCIDFKIAQRFYSEGELKAVTSLPSYSEKLSKFFQIWTLKESYIKALGYGLYIPLNSFEINLGDTISVTDNNYKSQFHLYTTELDDYYLSVCFKENCIDTNFSYLSEIQLVEYIKELYYV
ncbi:4'-phosphopantetheinyl transferase superfamily protein [Enterocloster clostridioformis]